VKSELKGRSTKESA